MMDFIIVVDKGAATTAVDNDDRMHLWQYVTTMMTILLTMAPSWMMTTNIDNDNADNGYDGRGISPASTANNGDKNVDDRRYDDVNNVSNNDGHKGQERQEEVQEKRQIQDNDDDGNYADNIVIGNNNCSNKIIVNNNVAPLMPTTITGHIPGDSCDNNATIPLTTTPANIIIN